MQSKSETANQLRTDQHSFPPNNVYSEPWWRGGGYPMTQAVAGANASNSSSLECPNADSESNDGQSLSNSGLNEEDDDASKESPAAARNQSGNYVQEHQGMQHASSSAPSMRDECFTQAPQLELVGHSIACASHPYPDPYYAGLMAAYGPHQLGYPPFMGMPQARMPLPLEMTQEPVYVNAKQYPAILRRRQARAKAELERKLIKVRKPYLHESRHQHAMRRARGTGGRFAKKNDATEDSGKEKDVGSGPLGSSQSVSSSGSEPLPCESAETWNSPNVQQLDARGYKLPDHYEAQNYANNSGPYHNHSGLQSSTYHLHSGERVEEGDCSGQQRGSISSEHTTQRRLAIQ
ncbi:hypothetical protein QN277_018350 [Acacia crassicarpa]|uniref:Nuclear transcription factor Y subunit n=1 Tax=Acacia crassicarpa TaxID=499986 RepID=A0AAE1JW40_9FABA|nr:hypothetical protein QN277_018350 [Acacia crassicarpa]